MFLPARVLSPLLCLRRPPHLLSPVLPGFLIAVKEQFKTEEVYLFNSISVFPCWVRDTGGTRIYIHLRLSHEIIYLRNLFPELCALSFTAVVCIFLSQQGIVTRGRRQIWNVQWWSLPRNVEKYEVTQQMSYLREDYNVGLMFFYRLSASLTFT